MGARCDDLPAVATSDQASVIFVLTTIRQVNLRRSIEIFPGIPQCEKRTRTFLGTLQKISREYS